MEKIHIFKKVRIGIFTDELYGTGNLFQNNPGQWSGGVYR